MSKYKPFKMKGSPFHRNYGIGKSPLLKTEDEVTTYKKYGEGGGDVEEAKKWNMETYGTENPTAEAKKLGISKAELAKRHKASKSNNNNNKNENKNNSNISNKSKLLNNKKISLINTDDDINLFRDEWQWKWVDGKIKRVKVNTRDIVIDGKLNPNYKGVLSNTKTNGGEDKEEGEYKSTKGGTDTDYYSETKRKDKIVKKEKKAKDLEAKLKDISSTDEKEGVATERGGKLINKKGKKRHALGKATQWVRRGILKKRIGAKKKSAERKRKKAEEIDREQQLARAQHEGKVKAAGEGKQWAIQGSTTGTGTGNNEDGMTSDAQRRMLLKTAVDNLRA